MALQNWNCYKKYKAVLRPACDDKIVVPLLFFMCATGWPAYNIDSGMKEIE